jgi:hypothetical protein
MGLEKHFTVDGSLLEAWASAKKSEDRLKSSGKGMTGGPGWDRGAG